MGEIVGISVRKFEFIAYKNTFGDLLSIFCKEDLNVDEVIVEGEVYRKYYFSKTITAAKRCLDCMGHTIEAARMDLTH